MTGSTSQKVDTPHTGTGRITEVTMYPMTLWETKESNGKISLLEMFNNSEYDIDGFQSDIELEDLFFAVCRGGWPKCLSIESKTAKLEIAKDYYYQIYADVKANYTVSDQTIASYIEALEKLYVIKDIDAWTPQIRSKTAIRSAKKHIFIDPSIGMAALGLSPEYFNNDLDLFGHVFENLVLRDLLVYAESCDAKLMQFLQQKKIF